MSPQVCPQPAGLVRSAHGVRLALLTRHGPSVVIPYLCSRPPPHLDLLDEDPQVGRPYHDLLIFLLIQTY